MRLSDCAPLVDSTARNLAGRPVTIRNRAPWLIGVSGIAIKTPTGEAIIDIDPTLTDGAALYMLLHELAHIRKEWESMRPDNRYKLAPQSVHPPQKFKKWHTENPQEQQADDQAAEWVKFAGVGSLEKQLHRLAFWPVDIENLIDKAVKAAIKKY